MTLPQVAACLDAQVERLSERVVDLVWERVPGYQPPRMRPGELAEAVTPNLTSVIARLGGGEAADPGTRERARRLGMSRALQGVPLDAVVLSYRCAERVMTDAFVEAGADLTPGQLREGLQRLAGGFDELSSASIEGYRDTQEEVTAHYDRLAGDLVTGLLRGDLTAQQVDNAAELLGWSPDATGQALALSAAETSELATVVRVQRQVLATLGRGRPGRILVGAVSGSDLFVVPGTIGPVDVAELRKLLRAHDDAVPRIAIGDLAPSLFASGASCRQALTAMHIAKQVYPPASVILYGEVLLDVLVNADRDASGALTHRYLAPLVGRPQLCETLRAYADADLSIRKTARALFVHANTVVYRLDRVRELTGFDPRSAMQLFSFVAALRAQDPDSTTGQHPEDRIEQPVPRT